MEGKMLKPLKHKCYQIQDCPEEVRKDCETYKKKADCWDHVDKHECCDRMTWQRCTRCDVWIAADKDELPEEPIIPKNHKL